MGFCKTSLVILLPVFIAYCIYNRDTFDPNTIRGKRVLVTGASSGIGEKVAYQYAKLGAKLVITARRAELLEKVEKKCKELGSPSVHSVPADMAKAADRKKLVSETEKQLGGLDILILNHAYMHYAWWKGTPENVTALENMMNINFLSFVDITSMLLNSLKESKGNIGVVSSVAGKIGNPGMAPYCSSKHAMQGFYSSLRQELNSQKTGVSVTLIVYGPVDSDRAIELTRDIKSPVDFVTMAGTTDDAADVLIKGVAGRAYEVYFPRLANIVQYLVRICPSVMENVAASSVEE
ncbi:hypothetical protein CHUAL_006966 [Chamberlinius hualienensis]